MRVLTFDPRPGRPVRGLRFAADGRTLAAVVGRPNAPRRPLLQLDLHTGTVAEPVRPKEPATTASDPAFGPDPRLTAELFVAPDADSFVRLADGRGDRPDVRRLAGGRDHTFTAVGFAADGGTLFVGFAPQAVAAEADWPGVGFARLDVGNWLDAGDPDRIDEPLDLDDPATPPTCFADTGAGLLAVGTLGGTAVVCDLLGVTPAVALEHSPGASDPPPVDAVLWSPDGRHLVTRAGGTLAVWDALTGRCLARPPAPRPLADAAFTPDGRGLLVASLDGSVTAHHPPRYAPADRLDFGRGQLWSVAVAPDGLTAAAGAGDGTAVLWDL